MPLDGMLAHYSSSISPSSLPECTAVSSFGGTVAVGVLAFTARSRAGDSRGGVLSLLVLYRNIMLGQCSYLITSDVRWNCDSCNNHSSNLTILTESL
jgi:hypothetical protein